MILKKTEMKEMPKSCLIKKNYLEKIFEEEKEKTGKLHEVVFFDAVLAIIDNISCVDPLKIRYKAERVDNGEVVKGQLIQDESSGNYYIVLHFADLDNIYGEGSICTVEIKPKTLKIVLEGEDDAEI